MAIEKSGTIDDQHRLILDELVSDVEPGRVRVIILSENDDIDESTWLKAVSDNPAFEFLKDEEEDIYSLSDGKPFNDER